MPADSRSRPVYRPRRPGVAATLAALLILATALSGGPRAAAGHARPRGHAAPDETKLDAPTPGWREGPARYLLSKDEDDAFRALQTDAQRREFIREFWIRRDPDPTTPDNEYRDLFYRRVGEANRLFRDSSAPGWKTDRGKIYVLLGPPDEVDTPDSAYRPMGDLVVWTYREPPGGAGRDTQARIRFVRDVTGEFRLVSSLPSRLQAMMGKAQEQAMQMKSLPESHQILDTIVHAGAPCDPETLRLQTDCYRAGDDRTLVVLTVGVRMDRLAPPAAVGSTPGGPTAAAPVPLDLDVVARLVGAETGLPTYDLAGPDGLRPGPAEEKPPEPGLRLFQGGTAVMPGRYTIYYGLVDRHRGTLASSSEPIEVPAFPADQLALSSVTLADRLERLEGEPPPSGYAPPFLIGSLMVQPRPGEAFRSGETLWIHYQIYGAGADPISGHLDLDIEYRFFIGEKGERDATPVFVPLGQPIQLTHQQNPTQGYSLALTDWARANYRLRVLVRDNLSAREVSREVAFHVL
jgi:GWxTD domain-containing protein